MQPVYRRRSAVADEELYSILIEDTGDIRNFLRHIWGFLSELDSQY
jgi:hypothetical protein